MQNNNTIRHRLVTALLGACFITAQAQVVVEARLDTADILIGEQVQLRVKCSVGSKQQVTFPYFQARQELTKGVEVVNNGHIDTLKINGGKRIELTRKYTITSFDSALYAIPPFKIKVDGKEYLSRGNVGLKVSSVPVDTLHIDRFNGPHDVVEIPFEWSWRILLLALAGLFAIVGAIALLIRLTDPRLITRRVVIHPPVPAHVTALGRIQKIKETPATDSKAYYTDLTEVLRAYIEQRFNFNAREMTTSEIIDELCAAENTESLSELKEVLLKADLVKFAKFVPSVSEQDHSLLQALDFVQTTKKEPTEAPKPRIEYVTLSGGRQHTLRIALAASAATLTLAALILAGITLFDLYECFG